MAIATISNGVNFTDYSLSGGAVSVIIKPSTNTVTSWTFDINGVSGNTFSPGAKTSFLGKGIVVTAKGSSSVGAVVADGFFLAAL